jgi:ClpP class serine protease
MFERILMRALNTPLCISQLKMQIITERVLIPIILGNSVPKEVQMDISKGSREPSQELNSRNTRIIQVFDTLFAKNGAGGSGATTYQDLSAQVHYAVDQGIRNIGFYIDSPGGEGAGLFALTDQIRNLRNQGIRTFSFSDGFATSAAYAIMAATEFAYSSENAVLGSIAALLVHVDQSVRDAQQGLTYTILRSKEQKALGDSHTPLSEEVKMKLEGLLASMDTVFNNDVLKGRPELTLQNILDMKGSEFVASEALERRLINGIVPSLDAAISEFSRNISTPTNRKGKPKMEGEELKAQLQTLQLENAELKTKLTSGIAEATKTERERCHGIVKASSTLGIKLDTALNHIEKGYSGESSLEIMTAIAEGAANSSAIQASTGATGTVDVDLGLSVDGQKTDLAAAFKKAKGIKVTA